MEKSRRQFLRQSGLIMAGLPLLSLSACNNSKPENREEPQETPAAKPATELFFKISLAQWSLHHALEAGEMDNLDFAPLAREAFNIDAVEYVNQFFFDKAQDEAYLSEMKKRADDNGVRSLLIMVDNEGSLGASNKQERNKAVENHFKWLEAAQFLGCHSIRVNAAGDGDNGEVARAAAESLSRLGEKAKPMGLQVLVENHGGYSSHGQWLSNLMDSVGMDNVGTLPDFGNFCITKDEEGQCIKPYNRYKGVQELLPYAKGVSAKAYAFDAKGQETTIDYGRMLQLVKDSGYKGYVGIEYEGKNGLSELEGIRATQRLLRQEGEKLS